MFDSKTFHVSRSKFHVLIATRNVKRVTCNVKQGTDEGGAL